MATGMLVHFRRFQPLPMPSSRKHGRFVLSEASLLLRLRRPTTVHRTLGPSPSGLTAVSSPRRRTNAVHSTGSGSYAKNQLNYSNQRPATSSPPRIPSNISCASPVTLPTSPTILQHPPPQRSFVAYSSPPPRYRDEREWERVRRDCNCTKIKIRCTAVPQPA